MQKDSLYAIQNEFRIATRVIETVNSIKSLKLQQTKRMHKFKFCQKGDTLKLSDAVTVVLSGNTGSGI